MNPKGHVLIVKIEYSNIDRQNFKEPGLSMYFNLNSQNTWYVGISEDETGIQLELHSGCFPMYIDTTNKVISTLGNNLTIQNNTVVIKLAPVFMNE